MRKTPYTSPLKQSIKEENFRGLRVSHCLQMCMYYVPAKLNTLNMSGPYFIWLTSAFQTNFSKQKEESLQWREDDQQIPHHNNISNTY